MLATFQELLIEEIRGNAPHVPQRVLDAFAATPRHLFVEQYLSLGALAQWQWKHVDAASPEAHWPTLYRDQGLGIFGEAAASVVTMSVPSFMAQMLTLLELAPGQRVFELGAGSGWNAALLGRLVSPGGEVQSVEILPELAERARRGLSRAGVSNVEIVVGDGAAGPSGGATFDRAVFTAGAYDIPRSLLAQLRPGGLLLFVLKVPGGGDLLLLLRKDDADCLVALHAARCAFVPLTGPARETRHDLIALSDWPPWRTLRHQLRAERAFPLGSGGANFAERSFELRSFLSVVEPELRVFREEPPRASDTRPWTACSGLGLLSEGSSLALLRDGALRAYGSPSAQERMLTHLQSWLELGLPSAAALPLRVYPRERAPASRPGEWALDRTHARFVWSAPRLQPSAA